jgi:hypothetical protein
MFLISGENLRFRFSAVEDTATLWDHVVALLPYKDVENEWMTEKFGIPVMDKPAPMGGQLSGLPVLQMPVTQAQGKGGFDPFVKGVHSPACTCGCTPVTLKWDNRSSVNPAKWSVENAFKGYSKGLQNAVEMTFAKEISEGKTLLPDMLKANVSRFSAAKAVTCDRLLQQDAEKEPDRQTGSANMIRTFDYWQQTEENTARTRARTAKQWQEFTEGDRAAVLPNIKWLRSVAIDKRPEHEVFAGRIWAKDDPFWATNMPGQEWNCKCDMQETIQPVTDGNESIPLPPVPVGLEGNPALTGEIFTGKARYFKAAGADGDRLFKGEYRAELITKHSGEPQNSVVATLATGKYYASKKTASRFFHHAYNSVEFGVADYLFSHPEALREPVPEELGKGKDLTDPKAVKNIAEKKKRGVRGYYAYTFEAFSREWVIKTEKMERGFEQLYSIAPKK